MPVCSFADPLAIVTLTSCAVVVSKFSPPGKSEVSNGRLDSQ